MLRKGVLYREPVSHPQKSVTAMRLLSAITDNGIRAGVSHNLYKVCLHYVCLGYKMMLLLGLLVQTK